MKTREEVEKLKRDWHHDPIWDIETTEGFEDYRDELRIYSENCKNKWNEQAQKHHDMLASFLCPIMCAGSLADSEVSKPTITCKVEQCAWWNSQYEKCSIVVDSYLKGLQEQRDEARAEAEFRRKNL